LLIVSTGPLVVGAALVDGDGRLLAARRAAPPAELAGWWEFPGGKVEPGETAPEALARECREELAVDIEVGDLLGSVPIPPAGRRLEVYLGRITAGEPVPLVHVELRWVRAAELADLPWLPADVPLVDALRRRLEAAGP
jgi:8-oxo-dGTP diphosphatase